MNILEFVERVATADSWPEWRVNNTKTAAKLLAKALGKSPEQCWPSDYVKPINTLIEALNSYLGKNGICISPDRLRQNRNYLRYLFRRAHSLGIIRAPGPLPPAMTSVRAHQEVGRPFGLANPSRYAASLDEWPKEIRQWWQEYEKRARLRIRPPTLAKNSDALSRYLGFLGKRARTVSDLFQRENLEAYMQWLAARRRTTQPPACFLMTLNLLQALARATGRGEDAAAISSFKKALPPVPPLHAKERLAAELTLKDIESVGLSLLEEARKPVISRGASSRPRLVRAAQFQRSLILRLLVRVPLRRRNIVEMKLGKNLYKDRENRWVLHFEGQELKIATRNGRPNVFHLRFPSDLVAQLEEFLDTYRPILAPSNEDYVFFTRWGRPFTGSALSKELSAAVYQRTRKHFYPHLIRTMWATEMAQSDADIRMVAYMLNDKIETVYKEYYAHSGHGLQERAEEKLAELLGGSARRGF